MKFEVKTEHKGDMVTYNVFCDWSECRNFLLVLTDNNGILIRDIAESLLQVGVYEHCNKWYTLRVTCNHDITIGEALKTVAEYDCISRKSLMKCKECPLNREDGMCLSIQARDAVEKLGS